MGRRFILKSELAQTRDEVVRRRPSAASSDEVADRVRLRELQAHLTNLIGTGAGAGQLHANERASWPDERSARPNRRARERVRRLSAPPAATTDEIALDDFKDAATRLRGGKSWRRNPKQCPRAGYGHLGTRTIRALAFPASRLADLIEAGLGHI